MQKRHFEAFARLIAESDNTPQTRMFAALVIIRVAESNLGNRLFDRERFLKACGLPHDA